MMLVFFLRVAMMLAVCFGDDCDAVTASDPYSILGVTKEAKKDAVIKAYRLLAKRWHPDRNRGVKDAEAVFARIAQAYEILMDPEKREIFDRLGEDGLKRLGDGDPTVKRDYLPPDEVLRRIHLDKDGAEPWHQKLVTSSFAYLETIDFRRLRWIPIMLGIITEFPSVIITATSDATGDEIMPGETTDGDVTFKFTLSGKSSDFTSSDITHTCVKAKFLGMKTTYYLQCAYLPDHHVSLFVDAKTFKVHGHSEYNAASERFTVKMQ